MLHAYIREIIRLHICLSLLLLLLLPDQTKTCWRLNVHTVQGRARRISQRIYRDVSYRNAFGQDGGGGAGTQMQQQILYPWPDFSKHTPFLCSLSPRATNMPFSIFIFFASRLPPPPSSSRHHLCCSGTTQRKRREEEGGREAPFYLLLGTVSF